MRVRLRPAQTTVVTAHAIALVMYQILKHQVEFEMIGVEQYEKKGKEQQLKYTKKKAVTFGYQLVPGLSAGDEKNNRRPHK